MLAPLSKTKALVGNLTGSVSGFLTTLLTFEGFNSFIESTSALGKAV